MVAHLDAVTSLAVDPNGLYLMSGSKYIQISFSFSHNGGRQENYKDNCFPFLQVMTVRFACGILKARPASKNLLLIAKNLMSPFMMWHSTPPNVILPVQEQMPWLKCSYDRVLPFQLQLCIYLTSCTKEKRRACVFLSCRVIQRMFVSVQFCRVLFSKLTFVLISVSSAGAESLETLSFWQLKNKRNAFISEGVNFRPGRPWVKLGLCILC